jgi:4-hydroxybenzoate polyprenyltransferase
VSAHFANAAPDVVADRAAGVLGLPQRVGARTSLSVALALLASVGVVLLTKADLVGAGLVVGGLVVLLPLIAGSVLVVRGQIERPAFTMVMVAAVADVALLLVAT